MKFFFFILTILFSLSSFAGLWEYSPYSNQVAVDYCNFQGDTWDNLSFEEFKAFDPGKMKCRDGGQGSVERETFYLPILPPLFPFQLTSGTAGDFAFFFPVFGNIGRRYTHLYLRRDEIKPDVTGHPNPEKRFAEVPVIPEDAKNFYDDVQEQKYQINRDLKSRRRGVRGTIKAWKMPLAFL